MLPATRRLRLEWLLLLAALLLVGGCLTFVVARDAAQVIAVERDRLSVLRNVLTNDVHENLKATNVALQQVIEDHLSGPGQRSSPPDVSRRLRALTDAMRGIRAAAVLDAKGIITSSSRSDILGQDFSKRDYFLTVRDHPDAKTLYVSAPFTSIQKDLIVTLSRMVPGPRGEFGGLVVTTLDPRYFTNIFRPIAYAPDVWGFVDHSDGVKLMNFPEKPGINGMNVDHEGSFFRRHMSSGQPESLLSGDVYATGERRLFALGTVQPVGLAMNKGLVIGVSRELTAIYQPMKRQAFTFGLFYVALVFLCGGSLFWLQKRRGQLAVLGDVLTRERQQGDYRLRTAHQLAGIGNWLWDLRTNTQTWSEEIYRIFGRNPALSPADVPRVQNYFTPASWQAIAGALAHLRATAQSYEVDAEVVRPDGTRRWIVARGEATRDDMGNIICLHGTLQDISDRKRIEVQLRASEAFNRAVLDSVTAEIAVLDPNGVITAVNEPWRRFAMDNGVEPGTASGGAGVGANYLSVCLQDCKPAGKSEAGEGILAVLQGRLPSFSLEYPCHSLEEQRWFVMSVTPLDSERRGAVVSHVNITDRRQAVATLRDAKELLQSVIETMPVRVFWKDLDARYLGCNLLFANDVGYSQQADVIGKTDFDMPWNDRAATYRQDDQAIMESGLPQLDIEASQMTPDGRLIWVNTSKVPLLDSEKRVIGVLCIYRDITDSKRLTLELDAHRDHLEELVKIRTLDLATTRDAAEAANRSKADFLANMSHEIRSPLNAILGLAYLLEQAPLDLDAHTMVRKIRASGRMLLGLISDILDVSKIEAGQMVIEQAPFHLGDVIDNLAISLGVVLGDKTLELIIHPIPADVDTVLGDALRLEQVLINLSTNAIKFTPTGLVELRTEVVSRDGAQILLRFSVKDTGIGIPEELQVGIFTAFNQADSSTTRRFGGTGLGLTISRQLVNLMGGDIGVTSTQGLGSEFWFTLPVQQLENALIFSPKILGVEALIADDSDIALNSMESIARGLGWQVRTVTSGDAALAHVMGRSRGELPTVVVLDWKMPGLDGMATARAIRAHVHHAECPIVIMSTAYSLASLAREPGADQVDAILQKPVTASGLYNAVVEARRRRAATVGAPQALLQSINDELAGVRILVVDDSEINRDVAQRILSGQGALVSVAVDGQDAIDWLLAHSRDVDLVLMDVQMPVLDGIAATRQLRRLAQFDDLPIVALTAGAFKSQQDAAQAAGMAHFISKPFDVPSTIALIQRLRRPAHLAADESRLQPGFSATALADVESSSDLSTVDVATGLQIWSDVQTYHDYLKRFAIAYRDAVGAMNQCLAENNRAGAAALAHKLSGVAANMALPDTRRLAADAERVLSGQNDPALVLARLEKALNQVIQAIERMRPPAVMDYKPMADKNTVHERLPEDPVAVKALLVAMLGALDTDSPGTAKKILAQLETQLPSQTLERIWEMVRSYDFRGAEAATLRVASDCGITLNG